MKEMIYFSVFIMVLLSFSGAMNFYYIIEKKWREKEKARQAEIMRNHDDAMTQIRWFCSQTCIPDIALLDSSRKLEDACLQLYYLNGNGHRVARDLRESLLLISHNHVGTFILELAYSYYGASEDEDSTRLYGIGTHRSAGTSWHFPGCSAFESEKESVLLIDKCGNQVYVPTLNTEGKPSKIELSITQVLRFINKYDSYDDMRLKLLSAALKDKSICADANVKIVLDAFDELADSMILSEEDFLKQIKEKKKPVAV